ncbi:MAG TPA: hypothetical protein VIU15_32840 [Streptomyces sp.]
MPVRPPRVIPRKAATGMILTGRRVTAAEATPNAGPGGRRPSRRTAKNMTRSS